MNTMNKMFMVLVDSHSKWLKAEIMPHVTSETTIEKLRNIFAWFGIPERLISDNGPQFSSSEFAEFSKRDGILKTHIGDTVQPKITS